MGMQNELLDRMLQLLREFQADYLNMSSDCSTRVSFQQYVATFGVARRFSKHAFAVHAVVTCHAART